MSNNEMWSLESLTFTPFVLNGAGTDYKLKFKVYLGSCYIDVMKGPTSKSEVFKSMTMIQRTILVDNIDKIIQAGPETHRPIVIGKYDKEQRKFLTDYVIELYKDSKLVYHVFILVKGNKFDFIMSGPNGISIGSDPLSEADRSMYCMKSLRHWLTDVCELQIALSNKRRDPSTFHNGSRSTSGNRTDSESAGPASQGSDMSGSEYF